MAQPPVQATLTVQETAAQRAREKVLAFVAAHPEPCRLNISGLLLGTDMTRSALYRALQADGGVDAFLMNVRLNAARALIGAGVPLADVRRRCGFDSGSHFSRRYKGCFGVAPREHARSVTAQTSRLL